MKRTSVYNTPKGQSKWLGKVNLCKGLSLWFEHNELHREGDQPKKIKIIKKTQHDTNLLATIEYKPKEFQTLAIKKCSALHYYHYFHRRSLCPKQGEAGKASWNLSLEAPALYLSKTILRILQTGYILINPCRGNI